MSGIHMYTPARQAHTAPHMHNPCRESLLAGALGQAVFGEQLFTSDAVDTNPLFVAGWAGGSAGRQGVGQDPPVHKEPLWACVQRQDAGPRLRACKGPGSFTETPLPHECLPIGSDQIRSDQIRANSSLTPPTQTHSSPLLPLRADQASSSMPSTACPPASWTAAGSTWACAGGALPAAWVQVGAERAGWWVSKQVRQAGRQEANC